jgi:uncharacterized phage-associated protein
MDTSTTFKIDWLVLSDMLIAMTSALSAELRLAVESLVERATLRDRSLNRTQIVKLLYFADLRSIEESERPITGAHWIWHNHGPFDAAIYQALDEMEADEVVGHDVNVGSLTEHTYVSLGQADDAELSAMFDTILDEYGHRSGKSLIDLAYATPPMRVAQDEGARGVDLNLFEGTAVEHGAERYDALLAKPLVDNDAAREEFHRFLFA